MRFLGGLLFHIARVIAGLFAIVALSLAILVGWWMHGVRQNETASDVAAKLKKELVEQMATTESPPETGAAPMRVVNPEPPQLPEEATAPPEPALPPPPRIDAVGKIDEATRDYFDKVIYLVETGTPRNPKSCDDMLDWVLWVSLAETWRSEITRDQFSFGESLSFFMTMGASAFVQPGNERWTIFTGEAAGRYITFTLGESRRDSSWDKVGAQTRMTFYRLDDNRLGLVEQVPLDTPPAARPGKKAPKIGRVYLVCQRKPS